MLIENNEVRMWKRRITTVFMWLFGKVISLAN